MVFRPAKYYMLKTVALIVSILIVLGFLFFLYKAFRVAAKESAAQANVGGQHQVKKTLKGTPAKKHKK